MADRIKLGGLWLNKSRDGREYLSGRLSPSVKILIFKNDYKNAENQPSYVMYLAPVETEETAAARSAGDSFLGGDLGEAAENDGDGGEEEGEARSPEPAPARPAGNTEPPARGARTARGSAPAAGSGGRNNPAPSRASDGDLDDLDDPFAE